MRTLTLKTIYKSSMLTIALVLSTQLLIAQDFPPWPVHGDAAAVENPVVNNKTSLEAGKALYDIQCKACHGEKGHGDGLIKAANMTTQEFTTQSDGAILWKIQEGRSQMPSFKALSEDQLWNVINYIRTLSGPKEAIVMKNATLKIFFNETADYKEVTAQVKQVLDSGQQIPAAGIKVNFAVKRYFGTLPIAINNSHYTNDKGEVTIPFNEELIGDMNGDISLVATIGDMEYNPAEASEVIAWGKANPDDYWSNRRALWKNNAYVPLWLLASFLIGAGGVWLFIIYVM
nr:cytochrome c [Bacteroidota bacterium]